MPAVDATKIYSGLYQGSRPPVGYWVRAAGFNVLVLAAKEYQPPEGSFLGVRVVRAPLDDAVPSERDKERIGAVGFRVAELLAKGRRVLVTCQMGLNRSGVITAVAMGHMTGEDPLAIVRHIKKKRGGFALSNAHFVKSFVRGELGGVCRSKLR